MDKNHCGAHKNLLFLAVYLLSSFVTLDAATDSMKLIQAVFTKDSTFEAILKEMGLHGTSLLMGEWNKRDALLTEKPQEWPTGYTKLFASGVGEPTWQLSHFYQPCTQKTAPRFAKKYQGTLFISKTTDYLFDFPKEHQLFKIFLALFSAPRAPGYENTHICLRMPIAFQNVEQSDTNALPALSLWALSCARYHYMQTTQQPKHANLITPYFTCEDSTCKSTGQFCTYHRESLEIFKEAREYVPRLYEKYAKNLPKLIQDGWRRKLTEIPSSLTMPSSVKNNQTSIEEQAHRVYAQKKLNGQKEEKTRPYE